MLWGFVLSLFFPFFFFFSFLFFSFLFFSFFSFFLGGVQLWFFFLGGGGGAMAPVGPPGSAVVDH